MTVRAVVFPSGALGLEGVLHEPAGTASPAVAVCHPHPLYGGDMENGVVVTICERLAAAGIMALRFNFRGVGRSEGSFEGGEGEREDARAAVAYLEGLPSRGDRPVGLAGYSFGAAVALRAAGPPVRALAAVSPPVAALEGIAVAADLPLLVVAGDRDEFAGGAALAEVALALGGRAEVVMIPGADHFWWGHLTAVAEEVAAFFRRELS